MKDDSKDVKIDRKLFPFGDRDTSSSSTSEKARLDVSATGYLEPNGMNFLRCELSTQTHHPTWVKMQRPYTNRMRMKRNVVSK